MIDRLTSAKSWLDENADVDDIPNSVGLAAMGVGNAGEVTLIGALIGTELRTRSWRGLVRIVTPMVAERLMIYGLDQVVGRDRPKQPSNRPGGMSPSSSSFPSGHASNAFLSATLLSTKAPAALVYGIATVVSVARLVMRVHHPSDVIGGAIAGVAIGRAMNSLLPSEE